MSFEEGREILRFKNSDGIGHFILEDRIIKVGNKKIT